MKLDSPMHDLPSDPQSQDDLVIWRRNAPYFYQVLYTNQLQWPSLTVQWRNDPQLNPAKLNKKQPCFVTDLVYGTNTSNHEANYLAFGKVRIPNQDYLQKQYRQRPPSKHQSVKKNDNAIQSKIQIKYEVQHPGEVNRVRYNPKMPNLLASRTASGDILIIDQHKYIKGKYQLKPCITLKGHQGQGFAIQWNKHNYNLIAGGSYDGKLSVWNMVHKTMDGCINPMSDFSFHKVEIEDVSFNHFHDSIFASCDDDGYTAFWDMRSSNKPTFTKQTHLGTIYSLEFSPLNEFLWASGGQDKNAKVFDIRNTSEPLFQWSTGQQEISNLRWSSDDKTSLWTVNDKLMTMWDVCDMKAKYVHGGHLKRVNQMSVHPNLSDVFASVDEDNAIHVFQPNKNYR